MGKIGNDPFGEIISNILKSHDAEQGMLVSEEESTSYTVALALPGVDRIFLHHPGANHTFRARMCRAANWKRRRCFILAIRR